MRHKVREQSYVHPELRKKVQAYASARGWTRSAFTKEAYERFLAGERGDVDLVGSRLDTLTQRLERLQNTLELSRDDVRTLHGAVVSFSAIAAPDAGVGAAGGEVVQRFAARGREEVQRRPQV